MGIASVVTLLNPHLGLVDVCFVLLLFFILRFFIHYYKSLFQINFVVCRAQKPMKTSEIHISIYIHILMSFN